MFNPGGNLHTGIYLKHKATLNMLSPTSDVVTVLKMLLCTIIIIIISWVKMTSVHVVGDMGTLYIDW